MSDKPDPRRQPREYALMLEREIERLRAAIRWALGEQPDPQGTWFVPPEVEGRAPRRYWWRSHLRKLSGMA